MYKVIKDEVIKTLENEREYRRYLTAGWKVFKETKKEEATVKEVKREERDIDDKSKSKKH